MPRNSTNNKILIELQLQGQEIIKSMAEFREILLDIERINRGKLGLDKMRYEAEQAGRASREAALQAQREFTTLRNVVYQSFNAVKQLGSAMQQLSRFGLGRFVSTIESTLVSRATGLFTSQLDNAVERFDIMKTFPAMMGQIGISTSASAEAIQKLNDAVLGLPTSLTEIMSLTQDFAGVMRGLGYGGDELLDKSSDFAIAINNAFLAAGANSQEAYYAMRQFRDLFSKGELRAQEWQSIASSLSTAGIIIAEEFDYSTFLELASAINSGDVALEDFIDGIIRLGTEEGKLAQMSDIYKGRISAVFTNIGNAFQRLIAGRIETDENGETYVTGGFLGTLDMLINRRYDTDKGISGYIKEILIPRIDELSRSLENWMIEHEDDIFNFLDKLINYDWEGLAGKIGQLLALKWDVLIDLFTKLPTGLMAFNSVLAGPIGNILQTGASILQPLAMMALWLGKSPGAATLGGGTLADWAWYAGASASESGLAAFGTTMGAVGLTALLGAILYPGIKSSAGSITRSRELNELLSDYNGRMNQYEFLGAWQTVEELGYLTGKEVITKEDEDRIKEILSYLGELLPDISLEWDDILQKVKLNGDYLNDTVGYLETHLEVMREKIELQDLLNKKIDTENTLRALADRRTSQSNALQEFYEKYGEKYGITPGISPEELMNLPGVPTWVLEEYANLTAGLNETDRAINTVRTSYIALNNQIQTHTPEWESLVKEFEETYGEIPEEVMTMIEEGEVVIPSSVKTLWTLCQRVIEENSIADPVEEQINEIPNVIERGRTNARTKAMELGEDIKGAILVGASANLANDLFYNIGSQINSAIQSAKANITYWGNNSDPLRGFGSAFGGRIYRQGGTDKDTVLTWLQPGEYVLRKKAADALGGDILNKFNSFNFKGALEALSEQVGIGMSPYAYAGGISNTKIYNNNAQATIHVTNASQEFTQRRASKWVRGLK